MCRVFNSVPQEILLVAVREGENFWELSGGCPQLSANTILGSPTSLFLVFFSPIPPKLWIFAASLHHSGAELPGKFVLQGSQLLCKSRLFKSNLGGRVLSPAWDRLNKQKKKRLIKLN